ncbi:unnamed protein product [Durusdinium trenchii]|uniref:Uncharacterized protein n=1 Tax=Durusdinium trenchii TaxID=1381693 RepID=A0ABP0I1V8_9DINO
MREHRRVSSRLSMAGGNDRSQRSFEARGGPPERGFWPTGPGFRAFFACKQRHCESLKSDHLFLPKSCQLCVVKELAGDFHRLTRPGGLWRTVLGVAVNGPMALVISAARVDQFE